MGKYTELDRLITENHEILALINFMNDDVENATQMYYQRLYKKNLKEIETLERELYGDAYNNL